MAEYVFEREFTSPRPSIEVFDEIDDHLIEKLGGKVHYSRARRKYVVQGPSRGINYGPLMNLKIFFDLRTDNQGKYSIRVKMERKPSWLLWALFPIGIILTFAGLPVFWLPAIYLFAHPKKDIEKVVDSFIRKMNSPLPIQISPTKEVFEAIIIEREPGPPSKPIPEGKVLMEPQTQRSMVMSLGIAVIGAMFSVLGFQFARGGSTFGVPMIIAGIVFMFLGAAFMIILLARLGRKN